MFELLREELVDRNDVLEVAAGTGAVTVELARLGKRLVATDYSESMLTRLRARLAREELPPTVAVRQANLYQLDPDLGPFDAIVAANVLHLVPDLPAALRSLASALRPGGSCCCRRSVTSRRGLPVSPHGW